MATESTRNWPGIALWALTGLLALAFAGAAVTKLLGTDFQIEIFANLGLPTWFMYVTGVVEAVGVVALLIPRVSGLGALWLAATMAVDTVIISVSPEPLTQTIPAIVFAVLLAFIAYRRRDAITWALATLRGRTGPA